MVKYRVRQLLHSGLSLEESWNNEKCVDVKIQVDLATGYYVLHKLLANWANLLAKRS